MLPPLPEELEVDDQNSQPEVVANAELKPLSLKDFFENFAPCRSIFVEEALAQRNNFSPPRYFVRNIDLELHCEKCGGVRAFEKITKDEIISSGGFQYSVHLRYRCRNCRKHIKLYSLLVKYESDACLMTKLAEVPEFGTPVPAKIFRLIGAEREYFLKGRRSENQGLGIGAFAYYRRVVENQKNRIIDEVIRASKKINAPDETIIELAAAKTETQFSNAVASIRHGIPQALMINGHNPLTLLHSALSEGMHAQTDDECLSSATTIRIILTALAERIGEVLKDQTELDAAVTKLMAASKKSAQTT